MSEVQHTTAPVAEATEPTGTAIPEQTESMPTTTEASALPVEESQKPIVNGEPAKETTEAAAPVAEEKTDEAAPVAATEKKAEKAVEPISEGVLSWKGPGLLKSLIPSKKEFWLSDAPVTPQHMDMYMRGEKPEISNAVVSWASQTGKGLLFFNKQHEANKTRPQNVLPLYDATELKKAQPHEITFFVHGSKHTLKASDDAERDGWFMSLERAMEIGKADKESVRASEGYKTEMEKLNKPNTFGTAAAGATSAARSQSQPQKAVDADKTEESKRAGSGDEQADKKQKSRSTSRGMLNRLKGKKDEMEAKQQEKKEEKKEEKEEKKAEKEEAKMEKEAEKSGEAAPAAALAGGSALDAPSTAERVMGAPVEDKVEPAGESGPVVESVPKTEEKPKINKRGSIFGRFQTAFSPAREKDMKEAELKPEVPPKDAGVSETAPQIPEPKTETTVGDVVPPTTEAAEPTKEEGKPAEAAKEQLDTISPSGQKKNFLSGLPFMNKRDRSVSPSMNMKDAPAAKTEETPAVPAKEETATEPVVEEPIKPVTEAADKPVETTTEEPSKAADTTSPSNKRQSVFGNLGRRASKAFGKGMQPRKENATPATTETKKEEALESKPVEDKPLVNGESKPAETKEPETIGDVVPDAVNVGQAQTTSTPTVTASA